MKNHLMNPRRPDVPLLRSKTHIVADLADDRLRTYGGSKLLTYNLLTFDICILRKTEI